MRKPITWTVIADGSRARVLQDAAGPHDRPRIVREMLGDAPPSRDLVSDRGGRGWHGGSAGHIGHAIEPDISPHLRAKARFLHDVARAIGSAAAGGRFDRLIVVAPPRALAELRRVWPPAVRARIIAETAKDLTPLPVQQLPEAVQRLAEDARVG